MRLCMNENCNNQISTEDRKNKVYCSQKCGNIFRVNRWISGLKDKEEYKKKHRLWFKKWYQNPENKKKIWHKER